MSNLKKLESMMNAYSKPKEFSDEERKKDIQTLKQHEVELVEVGFGEELTVRGPKT